MGYKVNILFFKRQYVWAILLFIIYSSCTQTKEKRAAKLYTTHCASCHILPNIEALPKHIWDEGILPEMAARMGVIYKGNDPYVGLTFQEQGARIKSGVYPSRPLISMADWEDLRNYILFLAPDSLAKQNLEAKTLELNQFIATPLDLDGAKGTFITFLEYNKTDHTIVTADLSGIIKKTIPKIEEVKEVQQIGQPITSYIERPTYSYITSVGYLNPSEIPRGYLQIEGKTTSHRLPFVLHRPVHTLVEDLNSDGIDEIVICEFGHLTGALSLFTKKDTLNYSKEVLLNAPGTLRTIAKDMNGDCKLDLVVLTSQGREGITIFYQKENLSFVPETVIQFSPVYGSSWFELVDFDGDGDDDIITAHGDNADKSYVQKPYHGVRIHLNDGENNFKEAYFYPLNGTTRLIAEDFDQDGDIDLALLATFPDYENKPKSSFVYLENKNSKKFKFQGFTFKEANVGRWLLMDSGDFDQDGDKDIVLSSFTYGFTPVPEHLADIWDSTTTDIIILENKAK
jgi:hypothetical protein